MAEDKKHDKSQFTDDLLKKLDNGKLSKKRLKPKTFRLKTFHFFHRLWHILFSIPFTFFAFIVHLVLILRKVILNKPVYNSYEYYGKKGKILKINFFNAGKLESLSLFYYLLSGKLSLTGYSLNQERCSGDAFIYDYPPGIITLWFIRASSRTAYEGQKATDMEFISEELLKAEHKPSIISFVKLIKAEFLLIIRFLIAKIFHSVKAEALYEMIDPIYLFSIRLRNISMQASLNEIRNTIITCRKNPESAENRKRIYFVNPDCLNKFFEKGNDDYHDFLYNVAEKDMIFADGIGINIAADMMGFPKNENVNGTDLFPRLCELAAKEKLSLFLLGARPGIPDLVKEKMEKQYPGLNIAGVQHGYFDHEKESSKVIEMINDINPDIVLVAFGVPGQERWINKWYDQLKIPVIMGVGGLFDFYSGRIKRAPRWMRDIGLEWVFRLLMEPRRMFKRYIIGNPLFLKRVKALKKCNLFILKSIRKSQKKKNFQTIDIRKESRFINSHCELIDLVPQLFTYCRNYGIKICLSAKNHPTKNFMQVTGKLFDGLDISDIPDHNNFCVVIADHEPENKSNHQLWLCDPRFFKESNKINIL